MKKKMIIILSVIVIGVVMLSVLFFLRNDKTVVNYTEEEIKFKDEYENLNGYEYKENYVLKNVDIDIDNNIEYVNDDEILDLLNNGTNVIYFGWADCNWCRSIVPTLIKTAKLNNVDKVYYYDFKSLRNNYENNTDDEKVKIYENILKVIGEKIESVFDENSLRKGEKKILAPTVVFIKEGTLLGVHVKSVDSQLKSTDDLNDKQMQELENIYQSFMSQLNANVCVDEGC